MCFQIANLMLLLLLLGACRCLECSGMFCASVISPGWKSFKWYGCKLKLNAPAWRF
jgi:hypothetical protein